MVSWFGFSPVATSNVAWRIGGPLDYYCLSELHECLRGRTTRYFVWTLFSADLPTVPSVPAVTKVSALTLNTQYVPGTLLYEVLQFVPPKVICSNSHS